MVGSIKSNTCDRKDVDDDDVDEIEETAFWRLPGLWLVEKG